MKPDFENLDHLLDAYFDGSLDEARRDDLDRHLKSSAEARERFWQRAGLEASLEDWAEKSRGGSMVLPPPSEKRSGWRHLGLVSGWAAAAVLLMALLWKPGGDDSVPPVTAAAIPITRPPAPASDRATPVAYLSKVSGVAAEVGLVQGRTFGAGVPVTVGEGLLALDFYSGARVFIEGPASFVPESDMRMSVSEGRVQVEVPDSAKGFVLELPDGTVTDLGTSFGAVVGEGVTTRLQVSSGEIKLVGTRDGAPARRVLEGQALSLGSDGDSDAIDYQPMAVKSALESNSSSESERAFAGWEALCAVMAEDPDLLVHFRFLASEEGSSEVINHADAAENPGRGAVIAAEWSRGRWPGKAALSFQNPADRVRVDIPGEYPQASLLAWVRVNGLPRRYNGLFLSEFGIPGETHWQLSTDGRFWFGVRPREERADWSFHRAFSEPVVSAGDFGTWHLLATSYDASRKEVVHYMDGIEVHRSEIGEPVMLQFGRATLGNFFDPAPSRHAHLPGLGEEWSFRNWSGAIDEFALYRRVLAPEEIARIYEAGRPR